MSKIIFLDIDGPVLPERAYWLPGQTKPIVKYFDPCAVSLLNYLCKQTGAKIVIHSSWLRHWHENEEKALLDDALLPNTVTGWCIYQGIKKEYFADDSECTPALGWRYDRIDEYLGRHPEIEQWIAFDDEEPKEDWPHSANVVLVDFQHGITPDLMRKGYDILA